VDLFFQRGAAGLGFAGWLGAAQALSSKFMPKATQLPASLFRPFNKR
jgi:hypothetical protein